TRRRPRSRTSSPAGRCRRDPHGNGVNQSLERPQADVAVGHGAVVALEAERTAGDVLVVPGAARGTAALEVFVDEDAIVQDALEAGVRDLLTGGVELRCVERDVEALPLARGARGVDARGLAFIVRLRLVHPAVVDAAVRARA